MSKIDKVIKEGFCVGCGACSVITQGRIKMVRSSYDYMQADITNATEEDIEVASYVCPFTSSSPDENALGEARFGHLPNRDARIGFYETLAAGRVNNLDYLLGSSSGGMTSWVLVKLLSGGHIDGVIHLGTPSEEESKRELFAFQVSRTVEELIGNRKSQYYSASYAEALLKIRGDGRRYAVVGVPCYVKAARSLADRDDVYQEQLKYFVALVCGHMKSGAFAELLAWQLGVAPGQIGKIDFRVKEKSKDAGGYSTSAISKDRQIRGTATTREMVGGDWGHAVFQLKSCDYCDDIFGETADVSFGDAWIEKYSSNWQGTNIAVVRDSSISRIIAEGANNGELTIDSLTADEMSRSQDGNFRHRWDGLSVRLGDAERRGLWAPIRRITSKDRNVPYLRRLLVRNRQEMASQSHKLFQEARSSGDLSVFTRGMRPFIQKSKLIYKMMRIQDRFRRLVGKII